MLILMGVGVGAVVFVIITSILVFVRHYSSRKSSVEVLNACVWCYSHLSTGGTGRSS